MYDCNIVFCKSVRVWVFSSENVYFFAGEGVLSVYDRVFCMSVKVFFFISLRVCFVCQYHWFLCQ